jgi:hypothetical protein
MHQKDERSPVFVQFLDTLFQIMHQFPSAFQYSEQLLIFLGDHVHSSLFGTFLGERIMNHKASKYDHKFLCVGNCDCQRNSELFVMEETQSIWSYVFEYPDRFANSSYKVRNPAFVNFVVVLCALFYVTRLCMPYAYSKLMTSRMPYASVGS